MALRKVLIIFIALLSILKLGYAQNNPPVAQDDTASTFSGVSLSLVVVSKILNNDMDPDGDPLNLDTLIYTSGNGVVKNIGPGFVINYTSNNLFYGIDTLTYVVCDTGTQALCDTGYIIITVKYKMYEAFEYLDINNIKALFNANGSDFWNNLNTDSGFEVPKGSGKHTMFAAGLWVGGYDSNDSLHLAATSYNNNGQDFYTGPIMDSSEYSFSQDSLWNKLWKINKTDIDYHIANWNQPGYIAPDAISTWPGNGDAAKGQASQLAPYYDRIGDQIYDAYDGDYPLIKGDQTVYFIRNDDRNIHGESGGKKMKVEVHGMAYAYECSSDPALFTTVFVNYKIVNRSISTYDSTYIAIHGDMDIGDPVDDFIGSDVTRGSFFTYNGGAIDGTGAPNHYGQYPPAQSVTFLRGPLMESDNSDNPKGGCDASINGYGFGDGIIDNECYGMTHFMYYCSSCLKSAQNYPYKPDDYYDYLGGNWKDGTKLKHGAYGHFSDCTSCEETRFIYPGNSDTCNWGSGGIVPLDSAVWMGSSVNFNSAGDRRGIGSMGPFTFNAGDTVEIDIAYVYGRDMTSSDPYSSVIVMKEHIDSVRSYFNKNQTPCGGVFTSIQPRSEKLIGSSNITLYPNPTTRTLNVVLPEQNTEYKYKISDLAGRNVQSGLLGQSGSIDINSLGHGIFILRIQNEGRSYHGKFVKM